MKHTKKKTCPFCNKEVYEKQLVYETKYALVIHNIRPGKNTGRCVIVPKRHVNAIHRLNIEEQRDLIETITYSASRITKRLKPEGINYGINEGEHAGQTIYHLHIHILPRYKDDDFPHYHMFHRNPSNKKNLSEDELRPMVEKLKKILS